jgi:hypothetical protein
MPASAAAAGTRVRPTGQASGSRRPWNRTRAPGVALLLGVVLLSLLLVVSLPGAGGRTAGGNRSSSPAGVRWAGLQVLASNNGVSPPPTAWSTATYDDADGYVLMFGGQDASQAILGTTWAFGHNNWSDLTPQLTIVPGARWGASMAYDPIDHYVVMFGGCPSLDCPSALGDTWSYSHGTWSDLTPTLNV